jgi:hypothetical protein
MNRPSTPALSHWHQCPMHPEGGSHELMPTELRCVYCSAPLSQPRCNGCDRFLSIAEVRDDQTRCEECR